MSGDTTDGGSGAGVSLALSLPLLGKAFWVQLPGTASTHGESRNQSSSSFEPLLVTAAALETEWSSQSRRSFSGQGSDSDCPLPGLLTMLSEYQSHARVPGSPGEPGGVHLFSLNNCLPHKAGSGYRLRPHLGEVSIGFITDASRSSLGEMKGLQRYSGGLLGTLDSSVE